MLIEEGDRLGAADAARGTSTRQRLRAVTVPPTLAGVLQARLDAFPATSARRCSTPRSSDARSGTTPSPRCSRDRGRRPERRRRRARPRAPARAGVAQRALELRRVHEYRFKHALLRDAAYETVLLRDRGRLHAAAAGWMESGPATGRRAPRPDRRAPRPRRRPPPGSRDVRRTGSAERLGDRRPTTACRLYRRALESLARGRRPSDGGAPRRGSGWTGRICSSPPGDLSGSTGRSPRGRARRGPRSETTRFLPTRPLSAGTAFAPRRKRGPMPRACCSHVPLPLAEIAGGRGLADVLLAECWLLDVNERYVAAIEPARRALDASREVGDVGLAVAARTRVAVTLSEGRAPR